MQLPHIYMPSITKKWFTDAEGVLDGDALALTEDGDGLVLIGDKEGLVLTEGEVLVVTVVIAAGLSLCDDGTDETDEVCKDT